MGKWIDDSKNSTIWKNRDQDRNTYRNTYEGSALISKNLPDSQQIKNLRTKINNDFMHTNYRYYFRHTKISRGDKKTFKHALTFNDGEVEHKANLYVLLHLTRFHVQSEGNRQ